MNDKINSIIESYIRSPRRTDYAIMIDGKWGCGKTYYVENELKELIIKNGCRYIYFSLSGCNDISYIFKKITLRLLFNNLYNILDNDIIDNIIGVGAELSNIHPISKSIYNIFNNLSGGIGKSITKKILSEIIPDKIFIIFDDIERISNDTLRIDLISQIYEIYLKKGYKIISVGDESNIKNKNYFVTKEKVIRRTINYKSEIKLQIENFIENQFKYSEYYEYLYKNKDIFIKYIIASNIINLRTISFVFDNFFYIYSKLKNHLKMKFVDIIFINILLLTNEFKEGRITITDIDKKEILMKYPDSYYLNITLQERGFQKKQTYLDYFHDRYLTNPIFNDFKFIDELYNYILTGYLDINQLEQEIKIIFYNEFIPEPVKILNFLTSNLAEIEDK